MGNPSASTPASNLGYGFLVLAGAVFRRMIGDSYLIWSCGLRSSINLSVKMKMMELQRRFIPSLWDGKVRISPCVHDGNI